ncbi:MAG: T9SS type A sorting domain-containing protein [Bacteroidota bacterium]
MKKYCLVLFSFYQLINCVAQGPGPIITAPKSNASLFNYKAPSVGLKRAQGDTLTLPFFEDFVNTTLHPDPKRWLDNQVYVNRHFAVSPPSYGVATFDNLNSKGLPYRQLSGNTQGPSDTLTSKPINLKNRIIGSTTTPYAIADSIYFSFFYQPQGYGDVSDNTDSFVLKFKDSSNEWKTVWKVSGSKIKSFKQILLPLKDLRYFFNGFQFRFINFTRNTGNMNQWHLDYIRFNYDRNRNDTSPADVTINRIPDGPLKWYSSMPYDHYKVDAAYNTLDKNIVTIKNNNPVTVNRFLSYNIKDENNQVLFNVPTTTIGKNIEGLSEINDSFGQANFNSLPGKKPTIKMSCTVIAGVNDDEEGDYKSDYSNNTIVKEVKFNNYYAYDDGSAEGGYGLDYATLPNGPGYAAIKFRSSKADTLRGISIFFNQSVTDVSSKSFELMVWKTISEPPANNMDNDVLLRRVEVPYPLYKDSINGFVDFIFDTAVVLSQGNFYIGWRQNINFILNVGYDNNYRYALEKDFRNPNLFFNLNGYWDKVAASITGAVMMRPIVGEKVIVKNPASVNTIQKTPLVVYPNPSNGKDVVSIKCDNQITQIKAYDITGREVMSIDGNALSEFTITGLANGVYTLVITDENKSVYKQKFIKTE